MKPQRNPKETLNETLKKPYMSWNPKKTLKETLEKP